MAPRASSLSASLSSLLWFQPGVGRQETYWILPAGLNALFRMVESDRKAHQ